MTLSLYRSVPQTPLAESCHQIRCRNMARQLKYYNSNRIYLIESHQLKYRCNLTRVCIAKLPACYDSISIVPAAVTDRAPHSMGRAYLNISFIFCLSAPLTDISTPTWIWKNITSLDNTQKILIIRYLKHFAAHIQQL